MKMNVKKLILCVLIVIAAIGAKPYRVQAGTVGEFNVSFGTEEGYEAIKIPNMNTGVGHENETMTVYIHLNANGLLSIKAGKWCNGVIDGYAYGTLYPSKGLSLGFLERKENTSYATGVMLSGNFYLEAGDYYLTLGNGKPDSNTLNPATVTFDFTPVGNCDTSGKSQKVNMNQAKRVYHYHNDIDQKDSLYFDGKAGHEYKIMVTDFKSTEGSEYMKASYSISTNKNCETVSGKKEGKFDFTKAAFKVAVSKNASVFFGVKYAQKGDVSFNIKVTEISGIRKGPDGNYYYFKNNALATTKNGVVPSGNTLYYVKKGCVSKTYTGLQKYKGSYYYFVNGICDKKYSGVIKHNGLYCYVKNSKLSNSYTGTAKYNNTILYFTKGQLDTTKTGIFKCEKQRVYIQKGKWCRKTLIVNYKKEKYYVKKGVWQSDYMGVITINGKKYTISYGKVV